MDQQPVRVSLCPACGACPEVIVDVARDEVRIGEEGLSVPGTAQAGNLVHLTKEAWNMLVEKISAGELSKL